MKRMTNAIVCTAAALAMLAAMCPASALAVGLGVNDAQVDVAAVGQTSDSSTEKTYVHSATATSNGVTFSVQWDDASTAEEATTFHVTQTGGSSAAKARMDVPTYWDNGSQESVCDPTRAAWETYYEVGDGYDFAFDLTASGTYCIYFYFMDTENSVYYLRTVASVEVSDAARPSVSQIVADAVAKAKAATDGSEYAMALWLHDWTLGQLKYDYSLNYCSAESGLTRAKGTCESYQRIYAKLLDAAGIANGRVTGNGHTWNAVKIDGKWCQMDLTWDDTDDNWYGDFDQRHIYFGLTDEAMAIAHSDHTGNYQAEGYAYRSTDFSNNYFVHNGKAVEWAIAYVASVQACLDAYKPRSIINATNASYPPAICGIQNAIIADQLNQRAWTVDGRTVPVTVSSVVTSQSNSAWTAVYEAAAIYQYDVATYKSGSSSASWTHPTKDGYAFAGWYSDAACTTVHAGTTGWAYARFVPVSELISFRGCSLRDDGEGYDKSSLRFCYQFTYPSGCARTWMGWHWKNSTSGAEGDAQAASYWLGGGSTASANIVFAGVSRDGFTAARLVRGKVSYTTADGTPVTVDEGADRSSTVAGAAQQIASGGVSSSSDVAYAKGILGSDSDAGTSTVADGLTSYVQSSVYVGQYKSGSSSASWTHPTKDGYAFAGWYSDAACTTVHAGTTGWAYARFVPVSELISFRGCSLRDDGEGYDKSSLRFCYQFTYPSGCARTWMGWHWKNSTSGAEGDAQAASYWLGGGSTASANIVFAGVSRDGFTAARLVRGKVSYTTADGTPVTVDEGADRSSTVAGAAQQIASGGVSSSSDVAYAKGIIG